MNLKPLGDRIVVKQDEAQETTAGGLYIAAESKEKPQTGVVLAVGEGKVNNEGKHLPMPVKVGDRVLYGKYGGTEVDVDGEKVLILREIYKPSSDRNGPFSDEERIEPMRKSSN